MQRQPINLHLPRFIAIAGLAACLGLCAGAQTNKKPAPAKPAAPAAKPASATHSTTTTTAGVGHTTVTTATTGHPTTTTMVEHNKTTATVHTPGPMGHPAPAGSHDFHTANGSAVRMRTNGHPADIHDASRGMDIHNNLSVGRRVLVDRPGHSHLYFERGRAGYISHPYAFHGHDYARRTYYFHGRVYDRFYRPYGFHGIALEVYAPVRFYSLGFYGWAYHPWAAPIAFGWGFGASPWYGYYGAYWTPYPMYAGPNYWLTDYMISQSLQAQYEAQLAVGPPPPLAGYTPLTPDVKQQIADEVQRQLALESSEAQQNAQGQEPDPASSGIARMLGDGQPHVFVAGKEVDVTSAGGQECAITEGDVLQLANPPGSNDTTASLIVLAGKGASDCPRRAVVNVPFDDLQDMQNHMRETVDQGLQDLQAKQGQGGIPVAPPSALVPPVTAAVAQGAPPPDPAGAADLNAQAAQADQSEKDVLGAINTGQGPSVQTPISRVPSP